MANNDNSDQTPREEINLDALKTFFTEKTTPHQFLNTVDEFCFNAMFYRLEKIDETEEIGILRPFLDGIWLIRDLAKSALPEQK